jgi:quinol monooxygenase YgiN
MAFAAVARIVAVPDGEEALSAEIEALYRAACDEPGTTHWLFFREDGGDSEASFIISEAFADEAAYRAHEDSAVTAEISSRLGPLTATVQVFSGTVICDKAAAG